jgi:hypothetical protein
MGNRLSYLENESISTALRESEAKHRNRKKGVMQLLRMQEVVAQRAEIGTPRRSAEDQG